MTKVLVIDPVPALRAHLIKMLLETMPEANSFEFLESADPTAAIEMITNYKPALVVLDIAVSNKKSVLLLQHLCHCVENAKVLIWTQFDHYIHLLEVQRVMPPSMCFGYVLKTQSDAKLRYAIQSVFMHGNGYIDPVIRATHAQQYGVAHEFTEADKESLYDVLLGLTDKAIGTRRGLSVRGVQNRLGALSSKLLNYRHDDVQQPFGMSINPRTRLVLEALKRGLINAADLHELDESFHTWLEHNRAKTSLRNQQIVPFRSTSNLVSLNAAVQSS